MSYQQNFRSYQMLKVRYSSQIKKKLNKKIKVWIIQVGQYVATYFQLVLKCNTVAYFAGFITLCGKMTLQLNDKAH